MGRHGFKQKLDRIPILGEISYILKKKTVRFFSRSFADHQEFLPLLRTAAKASKIPGMSSRKAAVIGISSLLGSIQAVEQTYGVFPAIPYRISKVRDNLPNARVLPQRPRNPFNQSHQLFFSPYFPLRHL